MDVRPCGNDGDSPSSLKVGINWMPLKVRVHIFILVKEKVGLGRGRFLTWNFLCERIFCKNFSNKELLKAIRKVRVRI